MKRFHSLWKIILVNSISCDICRMSGGIQIDICMLLHEKQMEAMLSQWVAG